MNTQLVKLEKNDHIAIVTIDNPPLNVLSGQVTSELKAVFDDIASDNDIVVAILTGAGSRAFMAGADIKEFPQSIGKAGMKDRVLEQHAVFNQIDFLPKPTIAVLNGLTFGGGCELAITCDIRIAEEHAQLGLPEIKLGIFPGGGGTQRLPRIVGEAKAKELMFVGDPISAHEAVKLGLVNKVVATGQGMNAALAMAKKISGYSLQALSRIKKAVDEGTNMEFHAGIEREAELFGEVFLTEDVKEGVSAFIEKRKPVFAHK
ncbi:enoyl-CoA hydratase/isomerase family protein [Neobacillus rhizophilus]|uniref:Enoyl-CoA hydratase n=1 Tax=Neobacillus rhizophilus TaxID=2833579 RepID=A0A942UCC5_9BACI|nr:enoyl-CoA hydratase [Neobacillus rhizophilus]MBS4214719.1 enoyl-CoA hydratase [Neobacillus rhizophilus]MBU8918599.1 enoyl-CoA hydratase [Bacillus sp. FJAT-29953]